MSTLALDFDLAIALAPRGEANAEAGACRAPGQAGMGPPPVSRGKNHATGGGALFFPSPARDPEG